jgi:hypothetical protein
MPVVGSTAQRTRVALGRDPSAERRRDDRVVRVVHADGEIERARRLGETARRRRPSRSVGLVLEAESRFPRTATDGTPIAIERSRCKAMKVSWAKRKSAPRCAGRSRRACPSAPYASSCFVK